MRLAIVAASSYEANGQVAPIPNAEIDVELFGRRLAEPDAGFTVHAFDAAAIDREIRRTTKLGNGADAARRVWSARTRFDTRERLVFQTD